MKKHEIPVAKRRKLFALAVRKIVVKACSEELANNGPTADPAWHAEIRKAVESARTMKKVEAATIGFVRKWKSPEDLIRNVGCVVGLLGATECENGSRNPLKSFIVKDPCFNPFSFIPYSLKIDDFGRIKKEFRRMKALETAKIN